MSLQFKLILAVCITYLATVTCYGCSHPQGGGRLPTILIVLPDAWAVTYSGDYDGVVRYRLREDFPAKRVIETIEEQLQQQGWQRKNDDLFNPGTPNSHVRGWSNYIDTNGDTVFAWVAEWSHNRGDIVEYGFNYRYKEGTGPGDARPPLEVTAIYMSAITVNRLRSNQPKR